MNGVKASGPCLVLILAAVALFGLRICGCAAVREEEKVPHKTIQQVLREYTPKWMSVPGVVGTAIGEFQGEPCIRVLVVKKTDEIAERIPGEVDGFRVVVSESGRLRALD